MERQPISQEGYNKLREEIRILEQEEMFKEIYISLKEVVKP